MSTNTEKHAYLALIAESTVEFAEKSGVSLQGRNDPQAPDESFVIFAATGEQALLLFDALKALEKLAKAGA